MIIKIFTKSFPTLSRTVSSTVEDYMKAEAINRIPNKLSKNESTAKPKAKVKANDKLFIITNTDEGINLQFPLLPSNFLLFRSDVETLQSYKETVQNLTSVHVFCDGASQKKAGCGVCLKSPSMVKPLLGLSINIGTGTNNVAEYSSAVYALAISYLLGAKKPEIFMDSELVIKHLNRQYKLRADNLKPYYKTINYMTKGFEKCKFKHVPREENRVADELSKKAIELDDFSYLLRTNF